MALQLLVVTPEYNLATQAKMVPAICLLHNFICVHNINDLPVVSESHGAVRTQVGELGRDVSLAERNRASELRESIAKAMWESYQSIINEKMVNN
jgi:hypothetical protein